MDAHGSRDDGVTEAALTRSPAGVSAHRTRPINRAAAFLDRWESSEQAGLVQNFPGPSLLLSECPVKWQCGRRATPGGPRSGSGFLPGSAKQSRLHEKGGPSGPPFERLAMPDAVAQIVTAAS